MVKSFRKLPINSLEYTKGVLKEAREDEVTANKLIFNSVRRIHKRGKVNEI